MTAAERQQTYLFGPSNDRLIRTTSGRRRRLRAVGEATRARVAPIQVAAYVHRALGDARTVLNVGVARDHEPGPIRHRDRTPEAMRASVPGASRLQCMVSLNGCRSMTSPLTRRWRSSPCINGRISTSCVS